MRLFRELLEPQATQASPVKQDVRSRRSAPTAPVSKVEDDDTALVFNGVGVYQLGTDLTRSLPQNVVQDPPFPQAYVG